MHNETDSNAQISVRFRLLAILLSIMLPVAAASAAERPNFVLIMADDLGYADLGSYGSPIRTPNIDALAQQGMRFTDFYAAAPNCSPSRAGLLTGRTPSRVGVYDYIPPNIPMNLPSSEVTIAEMLKPMGYSTCHVGKWHLSRWTQDEEAPLDAPTPSDQGFDYWFATGNNASPSHHNPRNFQRNGKAVGEIQGYSCQLVADEAIAWLDSRIDVEQPFFLNVWFHEPHKKIASPPELIAEYAQHGEEDALYYANVTNMDKAVGRILDALDAQGLRDTTFVLFTSDNGPWRVESAGSLRARKSSLYEGGIRVPGIIRWPGHIAAGSETSIPAGTIDMFQTIAAITTTALPEGKHFDGTSLLPVFAGEVLEREQPLYWTFYKSRPMCVIRVGDYVLAGDPLETYRSRSHPIDQTDLDYLKSAPLERFELYDVRRDIGQSKDLAASMPERFEAMKKEMLRIHAGVVAEGPPLVGLPSDAK